MAAFEDFLARVQDLSRPQTAEDPQRRALADAAAAALLALGAVDRAALATLVREHPEWIPLLATCVELSQVRSS